MSNGFEGGSGAIGTPLSFVGEPAPTASGAFGTPGIPADFTGTPVLGAFGGSFGPPTADFATSGQDFFVFDTQLGIPVLFSSLSPQDQADFLAALNPPPSPGPLVPSGGSGGVGTPLSTVSGAGVPGTPLTSLGQTPGPTASGAVGTPLTAATMSGAGTGTGLTSAPQATPTIPAGGSGSGTLGVLGPLLAGGASAVGGLLGGGGGGGAGGGSAGGGGLGLAATIGTALGLGTLGVGLAGVIQKAVQGDRASREQLTQTFAQASPEQRAAITQAVQGFEALQAFSGGPGGPTGTLGERAPFEEQAFLQGITGAGTLNKEIMGNIGLGGILSQQGDILSALAPTARGLAKGELPMSPELARTVEEAFSPVLGDLARRTIEQARIQGFAGGADLLNQAPAAALAGPSLAALQGQMAQAKLALAMGLPELAGRLAGAFSTPAAVRGALAEQSIGSLGSFGQTGFQNRLNFLNTALGIPQGLGALGTGLQQTQGQTRVSQGPPPTLLDAFNPLASLLGGAGGLLTGLGSLSGTQTSLSGT